MIGLHYIHERQSTNMDKKEIFNELQQQRKFVITEGTGNLVRQEAWKRIDGLLDALNEVQIIELTQDIREL